MKSHCEQGCQHNLQINGLDIRATFSDEAVTTVCLPLLRKLTELHESKHRRVIAFLAGPPAAGKSTLAAFLQALSLHTQGVMPIQAVGIDGFHFNSEYIRTHSIVREGLEIPMRDVKGCPESYDVDKLLDAVFKLKEQDVTWPFYDRRLHDVVKDAIVVSGSIVLVEGNWLLLAEGKWASLQALCDYSVMLHANESELQQRLIGRKIMGGLSPREAEEFCIRSDWSNVLRCLSGSAGADMDIELAAI